MTTRRQRFVGRVMKLKRERLQGAYPPLSPTDCSSVVAIMIDGLIGVGHLSGFKRQVARS